MKRKLPTVLILLVMVLMGAMYWVDLCYYTDPASGFLIRGSVLVRYATLLLPAVMALLGLRTVGAQGIAVLRVKNRLLAGLFVAAAAVGVAYGVTLIVMGLSALSVYNILMGAAFCWYGVWMFLCALQLLVQGAPSPTQSALPGVLAALPFCVQTIYRVMIRPTSLYRLAPMVATLAALMAMLWLGTLLRGLYISLPRRRARWMYFFGVLTFLFATCLELPQAVYSALFGQADALSLMGSINMAALGLVAGCLSVSIAGRSDAPEDIQKLRPVE